MKRKKLTRKAKIAITAAIKKRTAKDLQSNTVCVEFEGEKIDIQIRNDQIFLPSGQSFEIPGRHVC